MENSFPVIIAISRKSVHIYSRRESMSGGFLLDLFFFCFPMKVTRATFIIARGKSLAPPALHDSPKAVLLLGEIGSGSLLGHKVTLPEQKDTLFKMLKLAIVKFLSCLRFKTLKTIPCLVAHDSYSFGRN